MWDEKRDAVPELNRGLPPVDVCLEVCVEHDRSVVTCGPSFSGETPVEKQPSG